MSARPYSVRWLRGSWVVQREGDAQPIASFQREVDAVSDAWARATRERTTVRVLDPDEGSSGKPRRSARAETSAGDRVNSGMTTAATDR